MDKTTSRLSRGKKTLLAGALAGVAALGVAGVTSPAHADTTISVVVQPDLVSQIANRNFIASQCIPQGYDAGRVIQSFPNDDGSYNVTIWCYKK